MSEILVDTDWLERHVDDPEVRVFDCTVIISEEGTGPGRAAYEESHIKGAGFLDLMNDFSDTSAELQFTRPSEEAFARAAGENGIGNDHHVVLYATTFPAWATRMWWMFRAYGHDKVSVLDGGFTKWQREGKPVESGTSSYPATNFTAKLDTSRFADKNAVLAAIDQPATCIMHTLSSASFKGEEGPVYGGRPGHIKGSENLSAFALFDENGCFLPPEELSKRLDKTSANKADKVITYCGGGIAASTNLFALALLGEESKGILYDGSLSEWAADESLPMET